MAERVQSQLRVDLFDHPFYIRREEVDLIDDRDYCQIIFHGQIKIGNRLSLHALRSIDQKKHAFARCQGAGNLIRKVDMTWRVDFPWSMCAMMLKLRMFCMVEWFSID